MKDKEIIEAYRITVKELTGVIESLNDVIEAQNRLLVQNLSNNTLPTITYQGKEI